MASTSHDSNLSNPTFPSTSNSSQSLALIASAFDQSGHSIFVSNPQRLSILSIQFDSSVNLDQITSISSNDTQHSLPFPSSGPSTSNPINHPNNSSTQSSHLIAAINPDLSSHPPLSLSASSSSTTTTSTGIAARLRGGSRPKSADIGARAREALYEIGRAARGVAAANSNSSQSTDLNSSALDSNSRSAGNVRSTMGGLGVGGGAHKGDHSNSYQQHANLKSSSNQAFINSNLSSTSSLSITSEIIVKPHSFTFGRDSRLTTCSIPLDISSNFKVHGRGGLESSTYLSSIDRDSDDDDDENSETESGSASSNTPPIEFVGDPNPISSANFKSNTHSTTTTNSNANGRAGVFVPFPDGATTSSSRSSEESERDLKQQHKRENSHRRKNQNQRNRAPFDPNRLLLKVSPPSDSTCRKIWSRSRSNPNSPVRVEKEVKLSFRLRLTSSAPFSDDGNNNSSSNNSNRRGFTSVQNEKGLGEVIFLTSESPEQIINAIAGGLTSDSVLSSEQVARLEGITRIVVNPRTEAGVSPRGARETEFEWKWSSLKRKRGKASSSGKCCCAFVELDQATGKASILSAFTFWVEMPSPSETEWNSSASPSNNFNVISSNSNQFSETDRRRAGSRPETPALIAALSLSNNRSDLFLNSTSSYPNSSQARTSWRKTTFSSPTEPPGYIFKRRSASDGRHQSHLQQMNGNLNRESSFSSSNYVEKALNELQLNLNHTELSLAESYSDSPILRAAITNLERRTASIKKSCKTSLKAFNELRTQITSLEASQNSIDDALNDLGTSNFNSSVDFLNRHFLLDVRAKNSKFRIQELDEMEKHFERPLQILLEKCRNVQEQLKTFESESKTYYSQTQKWLANKDASAESSQGKNEGDEKSAKLERSDEKQRLRQLKFDHARVELYKSLLDLHGGESELKLLDSLLMLSEFYSNQSKEVWGTCKGLSIQETRSILEGIKAQGQLEGKRIDFDSNETLHVLRELSDKIAISENCLNEVKDGIKDSNVNSTSTWDLLGMHPSDSTDQGLQNTAPTRQPGHRIKHLLTSLGMVGGGSSSSASANQPTSSSPPPAQAEMTSSVSSSTVASPTKPTSHGLRKKVSLKLKSSQGGVVDKAAGITSPVFGAFNRLRSGDGPLSPTKSNLSTPNPTTGSSTTFDPPSEVINIPPPVTRSPRLGGGGTALMDYAPESPIGDRTMMAGIGLGNPTLTASHSPKNRRSNSHGAYGSASPQARMLELAAVAASSQGSPRMRRGLQGRSPSLSRSSSDGHATMETLRSTLSSDSKRASQGLGLGGMSTPISEHESNQTSAAAAAAPRFGNTTSLSPTSNASRGRKKEGILWVMSKAIAGGPGGADAPRAANRTNAWKESWVVLSGSGHLGEYADWKDAKILSPSSPLIDLRFATVREARGVDRRFCFEIVTRENRRLFQASDESSMKDWVNSISKAIESLINGTSSVRQIDKVARSSEKGGLGLGLGGISPRLDGSDWGTGGGLRAFGDSTSSSANQAFGNNQRSSSGWQISQSKAFSQSLTDLSSVASGAGRFFGRNTDSGNDAFVSNAPGAKSGKRDSKNSSMLNSKSAHLSTLSESQARGDITISTPDSEGFPTTPIKGDSSPSASDLSRPVRHERGISNKTPVSGYVDQSPRMANINLPGNVTSPQRPTDVQIHIKDESTSTDISDWEFDRRIEELVHSNYGSTMNASHSELALPLSMSPSTSSEGFLRRQRKDSSNNSRQKHGRNHSVSSVSNLDFGAATSSSSSSQQSNSAGQRWDRTSSQDSNIRSKAARAAEIQEVASRRGNDRCADCGEPDPRWASWSLSSSPCCIFICISCSGVHRGLGVQISKVKSVDLDDWTEEQLKAARLWGNVKANSYWEHSRGNDFPRGPRNGINGNGKEAGGKEFYLMKYVQGRWKAEGTLDEWLNEYQNGNQEGQFNNVRIGEAFNSTPTLADRAGQVQLQVPNRSSLDCSGDTAPASRDLSRSSSKGSERIGG